MKRELKEGQVISFYGTVYTIFKVVKEDEVIVLQNNLIPLTLWFPDLPGCKIIKDKEAL